MNNQDTRNNNQIKFQIPNFKYGYWLLVIGYSLVIVSWLLVISAQASQILDPTDIGVGARPLGLGKAYTAIANDGSAIFTNPAGLSQGSNLKLISMAGNVMSEVPYTMFGGSYPLLNGTLGFGYVGLGVSGIKEAYLSGGTPEVTGKEGSFTNSALNLSYATDLEKVPYLNKMGTGIFREAKVGATFKLINQGFSGTASFEGGGGTGFDLDLGTQAKINEDTTAGLTVKNLIPGNNFKSDELPMSITAGVSKNFTKFNLLTAMDAEISRTLLFHLGCEWNPIQLLKIRLGLDQKPSAGSSITNLAAGMGISFKGFTFDYAYHTYAELSEFTTHFFSIGYVGEEKKIEVKPVIAPAPQPTPVQITPPAKSVPIKKTPVKAKKK